MTEWVEKKKWVGLQVQCQNPFALGCVMKRWAVIAVVLFSLAGATTVSDYVKMPAAKRNDLVVNFIDKMTTDIREKNPDLAVKIRNW